MTGYQILWVGGGGGGGCEEGGAHSAPASKWEEDMNWGPGEGSSQQRGGGAEKPRAARRSRGLSPVQLVKDTQNGRAELLIVPL